MKKMIAFLIFSVAISVASAQISRELDSQLLMRSIDAQKITEDAKFPIMNNFFWKSIFVNVLSSESLGWNSGVVGRLSDTIKGLNTIDVKANSVLSFNKNSEIDSAFKSISFLVIKDAMISKMEEKTGGYTIIIETKHNGLPSCIHLYCFKGVINFFIFDFSLEKDFGGIDYKIINENRFQFVVETMKKIGIF